MTNAVPGPPAANGTRGKVYLPRLLPSQVLTLLRVGLRPSPGAHRSGSHDRLMKRTP